jgi:hypothetical protein
LRGGQAREIMAAAGARAGARGAHVGDRPVKRLLDAAVAVPFWPGE